MTAADMQDRTKQFALRVLRLCEALPRSVAGRTIADQLGRASTSVAANYRAVRRARSRADFVHKLAVVEEEADESCFWLELVIAGPFIRPVKRVQPLLEEATEILKIVAASHITARANGRRQSKIADRRSAIAPQQENA